MIYPLRLRFSPFSILSRKIFHEGSRVNINRGLGEEIDWDDVFGLYFSYLPTLLRTDLQCATFAPVLIRNIWKSKTYLLCHHDRKLIRLPNSIPIANLSIVEEQRACCSGAALDFRLRGPRFNLYQWDFMYPFILPSFYPFLICLSVIFFNKNSDCVINCKHHY